MSRFIWILGVIVLVIGGIWLYNTYAHKDQLGSGLVISHDSASNSDSNDSAEPNTAASTQPSPIRTTSSAATPQQPSQPAPQTASKPSAALPVSDTIDRNPPNGAVFTGTGDFTWYRQGDITWRVNSKTGASCIAFATIQEWQKRIVYTHGCRNT